MEPRTSSTATVPIRYAQVGSPLIHAVPMTLGPLRPLCGGGWGSPIDPRDLFAPGSRVWSERRHPPLDGESHD